jgi:hypothetical protein
LANFNSTNIGNGALIFGTERVLREDWKGPLQFVPEPWDDYTFDLRRFDANFVQKVNEKDGLIVGAAVALNAREYLRNAGMRFDLPYDLWPTFSKPMVFYGISYRVWPYQKYHHLEDFKRSMDYILHSSRIMFSVRNDGTRPWLESLLGYRSDRIEVIPDPALYVPTIDSSHPELATDRINLLLSFNNEDEIYRYGGEIRERLWRDAGPSADENQLADIMKADASWKIAKAGYVSGIASALARLSTEWDINIILCPHYFDDYKMITEFMNVFPARLAHQNTVSCGLLKVPRAPYFYDLYAKADLVLSMRVHSMSPSIGLGTPMVALSSQPRLTDFMTAVGLQDFVVEMFQEDLADRLHSKLTQVLRNQSEVRRTFERVCSAMRDETRTYNRRVASFMSQG